MLKWCLIHKRSRSSHIEFASKTPSTYLALSFLLSALYDIQMGGRYSTTVLHTEGNNNEKNWPKNPEGGIDICYLHDTPELASEIGQGPSIRSLRAEVLRRCTMRYFPRGDIARTSVQRTSIPRGRRTRPYTNGLYCEHLPNKKSLSSNHASSRPRLPSETPSIGTRTTPGANPSSALATHTPPPLSHSNSHPQISLPRRSPP